MVKLKIELTDEEAFYLANEMNGLLRSYQKSYAGQRYDNENMGNVFNKVFKSLANKDHERWIEVQKERG